MNSEKILLRIPAKAEYLVSVRLVAGTLAGQAGFDMEEVEDTKTACSEACLLLIARTQPTQCLDVEFWLDEGFHASISAICTLEAPNTPETEISLFLLEALMDEAEFDVDGDKGVYNIFKQAPR